MIIWKRGPSVVGQVRQEDLPVDFEKKIKVEDFEYLYQYIK